MKHTKGSLVQGRMLALSTDSQDAAPCGCELFRSGSDGKSVTFRYCDTHATAPRLLEALETLTNHASETYPHFESERGQTDIAAALAAIKATKGNTS